MSSNIYILSAPIRSGKTSSLMEFWESADIRIDGILTPDIDGSRKMIFLDSEEEIMLEVDETYKGAMVRVGKFYFSQESFEQAREKLNKILPTKAQLIIIDEIGTLELNGLGFEPELSSFLSQYKSMNVNSQLILVVRDSLLPKVIEKYELDDAQVLSLHLFNKLFLSE